MSEQYNENPIAQKFDRGDVLFGYDSFVRDPSGEIISINSSTGEKPTLKIDTMVKLKGNSVGYVPSGHKSGDMVQITEFCEPFKNGESDHIIYVEGQGKKGSVKPSNIDFTSLQ